MAKLLKFVLLPIATILLMVAINFVVVKKLDHEVAEIEEYYPSNEKSDAPVLLASQFIEGARFYVKLPLKKGKSLLGFGDTGGGLSLIFSKSLEKYDLNSASRTGLFKALIPMDYVPFFEVISDSSLPAPYPLRSFVVRHPFFRVEEPYLLVPPDDEETQFITQSMPEMEAFLGQSFFMNHAWTIDYPNEQIWVNTPLTEKELDYSNVQRIGLKTNSHGQPTFGHASMTIEVDGEEIDVLFDTGATMVLSEKGKKDLDTEALTLAGSFIASSIMKLWKEAHPEWRFYPEADHGRDVIEVPTVMIGGIEVGPVLFSERPDENWSEGMTHSMDKVVKGAIGGSALQYVKVTVDFNSGLIKFEQS